MKRLNLICLLVIAAIITNAQQGKNIIKVNLPSISLNTYSFQYERVLSKRQSIALGIAVSPNTDLPFKKD